MGLLTSLLLALTTIICVILYIVRRLLTPAVPTKGTTNIPGPMIGKRWPIVGHALCFWSVNNMKDLFEAVLKLCHKRDKMFSLYLGSKLVIGILDAKILEAIILNSNKCRDKEEEFYHPFNYFSNGVFSRNGKKWSAMRRPLDRILHPKNMENFCQIAAEKAEILCKKVGNQCGQGVFDIRKMLAFFMLDVSLETLLHVPGTQQLENTMHFPELIAIMTEVVLTRVIKIGYNNDWIYSFSPLAKKGNKFKDGLRPHLKEMLNECYKKLEITGRNPSDPKFIPENVFEIAIQTGIREKMTEEELIFSVVDVMLGGFDTTSVTSSSTILFLAMHPEYQERAYQEQIEVMRGSLEAPTGEELSRMSYLDMVVNETLRHVSVPAVAKTICSEFTIDGFVFPEGASIFIFNHFLFNDPKYWERPKDYYPDHFLPENVSARPRSSFLPFAFGRRACPGKNLGIQSIKLVLSMLLRRYKFTTRLEFEEMDYNYMIMLESVNGYPVEATLRPSMKKEP
ncbi:hypothetical protein GE061_014046 [Apolygus lucorum]|uniref:Cytochrome P450 n=1 Tax=Apolygus lucorum TaxID=248454 RepID=A0A8S9XQN8_APOLU|nr:hypothetical protein GE061_014046 [Apolygus lucorum]